MNRKSIMAALLLTVVPATASAAPVQWAGNGHWYEWVTAPVDWNGAFAAANASSHLGLQGYLATVTSAAENDFVASLVLTLGGAWLGGSDADAEGNWTWRNGPENGQAFTFTNWEAGEPNNCCGGENYLQINWSQVGGWNDHGGPGNANQLNGYVVEYSAVVPEPGTYALMLTGLAGLGVVARRRNASRS